jgi:hypothetical protein
VHSILFVGVATLVLCIIGQLGVGRQEAFQLLWNASGIFYALTYVVMFAIPLAGLRNLRPLPLWLRAASVSGLLMTLLYVVLGIVPIIEVENRLSFALKISGLIVAANLLGVALFARARRA